jgi:hypothetical protein
VNKVIKGKSIKRTKAPKFVQLLKTVIFVVDEILTPDSLILVVAPVKWHPCHFM